jgi:hypothetical protein
MKSAHTASSVGTLGLSGARGSIDRAPGAVRALFLLLRTDRFPVRPWGLLRELTRPPEE